MSTNLLKSLLIQPTRRCRRSLVVTRRSLYGGVTGGAGSAGSRSLSSSSSSSPSSSAEGGAPPRSAWERGALRVKDTQREIDNKYMHRIREAHDPSLHLKTLEDELKSTIGQALRKQSEKILQAVVLMEREYEVYTNLVQKMAGRSKNSSSSNDGRDGGGDSEQQHQQTLLLQETVHRYNQYRTQALQARWELIVHRQAAGFIVDNHNVVTQTFPIREPLVVPSSSASSSDDDDSQRQCEAGLTEGGTKRQSTIPDQLDWWQRIGRWR